MQQANSEATTDRVASRIKDFTDLVAWKEAHQLVLDVYILTKKFPKDERFGLISQMRRCATSMTANIAEGFGRQGRQEKIQFYTIACGSTIELQDHLLTSCDLSYMSESERDGLISRAVTVNKLINGLIKSIRNYND